MTLSRRDLLTKSGLAGAAGVIGVSAVDGSPASAAVSLADHRSAAQLQRDAAVARRQLAALTSPDARARVLEILDQIQRRRVASGRGVPFFRQTAGGIDALIAEGQMVVRGTPAVTAGLTGSGYAPVSRTDGTQVFAAPRTPERLWADLRALRSRGIEAAPNPIVPLGPVIKGDDQPVPTIGPAGPPPRDGSARPAPVRVALVDTGIDPRPRSDGWLAGAARAGDADPLDEVAPFGRLDWFAGHGSFAAGVVQQVAPQCEIVVHRFTSGDGLGTDTEAAAALLRAVDEGIREPGRRLIVNASFGVPAVDGMPPLALQDAVRRIGERHPDVLIVASAGNSGDGEPHYPAAFDGVVAVGALHHDLSPAPFSAHGDWVDCSAVGVGVVSTYVRGTLPPEPAAGVPDDHFPDDAWALWSGTSFTAPQIAGAVARLCLQDAALTPEAALAGLLQGRPTRPGYGTVLRLLPGTPVN
jgi:hypothetical protein